MKLNGWKRYLFFAMILVGSLVPGCSKEEEKEGNKVLKHAFCINPCNSSDRWTTVIVDSTEGVGEHSSLALGSNDNLAISYYDTVNQDLKYAVCTEDCTTASSTWSDMVLDGTGDVGRYSSLKFDTLSNPHISYYDATTGDLRYAFIDSDSAEWKIVIVDSEGDVGWYTSLVIFNDAPRIAYYDRTHGGIKYAYCEETCDDSAEWSFITVAVTGEIPTGLERAISLAVDGSDIPSIAYYDVDGGKNLKYVVCSSSNCVTGAVKSTAVESPNDVGQYPSIVLDDGKPSISYYDVTSQNLGFVSCVEGGCTASTLDWSEPTIVDSQGDTGSFSSLVLDSSGFFRVAYYELTSDALRYAFCISECTNSFNWVLTTVDNPGAGKFASLAIDSADNPHMSYAADKD